MGNAQIYGDHTQRDTAMMARALELAARGEGFTAPNPMVGCIISHGDTIVGEGWHHGRGWHAQDGLPHAEVEALRMAGKAAHGGTAYVTLEPCNHHGTTPPCAQALIEAGIIRVVYAMADPNPQAAGGRATLRAAGITTQEGPLTEEAQHLNRAWAYRTYYNKPFVTAKFAASMDGKIATSSGDSKWITGEAARKRAHALRHASDAIIVGAGTVIADNPSLTARHRNDACQPLRIILDSTARTNPLAKCFQPETPGHAMLVTSERASDHKCDAFAQQGVEILRLPEGPNTRPDLNHLMTILAERGLNQIMVEGGADVLGSFFAAKLVQEVWAFIAPVIIGEKGKSAIGDTQISTMQDALRLEHTQIETLGKDILMRGLLPGALIAAKEVSCLQAS